MIQVLSDKIISSAVYRGYINHGQYEEYAYAMNLFLNALITDITIIAFGIGMHMVKECIIFWLIYMILRKYCGGYHFSTSIKCYLSSCVMCPVVLTLIRFVPYHLLYWSLTVAVSSIILLVLSPVAATNKPLDKKEVEVFGKIARTLIIFVLIMYIITASLGLKMISKTISLALFSAMIFVVAGKVHTG